MNTAIYTLTTAGIITRTCPTHTTNYLVEIGDADDLAPVVEAPCDWCWLVAADFGDDNPGEPA